MINKELIFSNKKSKWIKRHLLFWFCWWIYYGLLHAAQPFNGKINFFVNLPFTIVESMLLMMQHLVLTYYTLYFIFPKFLIRNKFLPAFLLILPVIFLSVLLNFYLISNVNPVVLASVLPPQYLVNTIRPVESNFYMGFLNAGKGALTVTAMAVAIKFMKHWYLKEQRNLQLQKENTEAQLKLLTAQVHPHFLFNTLNNIFSQTQTESPKGSKMIMELSDMLRYILAEGSKAQVPLQKELDMLQDYINLEKVRYGNKLDLHISLPVNTDNLQIAPLILLPFVENCFKHGASKFLTHPWINLKIELKENNLYLKLMNGKDDDYADHLPKSGTGIPNVQKRLSFLYPDKHQLEISDEKDVYIVNLWLQLSESQQKLKTIVHTPLQPDYA